MNNRGLLTDPTKAAKMNILVRYIFFLLLNMN